MPWPNITHLLPHSRAFSTKLTCGCLVNTEYVEYGVLVAAYLVRAARREFS